jgi:nitroreductase
MPIGTAPAVFVVSGNASRIAAGGEPAARERSVHFMWVEAGLAAQGSFLEATALGLGSTYVGGFRPQVTHALLGLPDSEEVLAILPFGRRPSAGGAPRSEEL